MELPVLVMDVPKDTDGLINRAQEVSNKITNNPDLTQLPVTVTIFNTNITTLQTANTAVRTKTGTIQDRDAAAVVVRNNIKLIANYVQGIADLNPSRGEQIIVNAGFTIKEAARRAPQGYTVESKEPGQITVTTPAKSDKYPIIVESSPDGQEWTILKVSRLSVCTVDDLPSGELLYVRYCLVGEDNNNEPYSAAISCRVR